MRNPAIFCAALLAACGGDPWVGSYEGTQTVEGRDCTTGDFLTPDVRTISVRIDRDDDGLFINGRCLIRLEELSARSARVLPLACGYAADDGTPVNIEIVSGRAERDGPELALEYSARATTPLGCSTVSVLFVGD